MPAPAHRHECSNIRTVGALALHDAGEGKPKRKKCRYCGSAFLTYVGQWGVFTWTGNGRYPHADVHAEFSRHARAQAWAESASPDYVVRWIPEDVSA